jgi:hypothetical protein
MKTQCIIRSDEKGKDLFYELMNKYFEQFVYSPDEYPFIEEKDLKTKRQFEDFQEDYAGFLDSDDFLVIGQLGKIFIIDGASKELSRKIQDFYPIFQIELVKREYEDCPCFQFDYTDKEVENDLIDLLIKLNLENIID